MTKKIFRSTVAVGLAVLLASLVIIMGALYGYFGHVQEQQLRDELDIAAAAMEQGGGTAYLSKLQSEDYRITWLRADGTVLYDTRSDAATMENHAQRQEVRQALETGVGESSRYSATLLEKMLYYAQRLPDGTVLRLSASRVTVGVLLISMLPAILLVIAAAFILSAVLAGKVSRRIVEPLNRLDLEHPLENDAYEELSPLLRRLEHQRRQIDDQLRSLRRKAEEFAQITASMTEGLVLVDNGGTVLSINPAACAAFHTDESCVGQPLLTVERDMAVSRALRDAMETGHGETRMEQGGREYQFDMTRIEADGEAVGAVLLTFDVTEQAFAERNRREFTANVSHELKTPLQGIIGSAELLENGMVQPDDVPRFVGHIRSEAQRLVTLINDIIRLSELDEGGALPTEPVELLGLCGDTVKSLEAAAEKRHVTMTVTGEEVTVQGVRRLLSEVMVNLCDNAIKYNRDGGSVTVEVSRDGGDAVVAVSDTGIGIPPEHQSRVFERFYRVDKSHSKASGGTGLGLSIVKHAVRYHHGTVEVHSVPDQGTTFTVRLPVEEEA